MLGIKAGLYRLGENDLVGGVKEWRLGDLVQIYADQVALFSDLARSHHRHFLHFGPSPVVFVAFPVLPVSNRTPRVLPLKQQDEPALDSVQRAVGVPTDEMLTTYPNA